MVLVVTVASVVEPFLSQQQREKIPQDRPEMISGVRIDIMTQETNEESDERVPIWLDFVIKDGWEVGWSLAFNNNDSPQGNFATGGFGSASLMSKSLTTRAILGVSFPSSWMHIANCYPPNSSDGSLLMDVIRCFPGTEGSPVFNEHACVTGIVIRPLRQKTSGAEIQPVVPQEAIATAANGLLQKWPWTDGMNFAWPSVGSKAVIGHGLFSPRCGFFPSVCSGVVAKVPLQRMQSCGAFSIPATERKDSSGSA
ncbi:hypothetical protein L6164_011817 [Bauhinia variegata]|uniref:Uncharacterized protein n=1 Tax=Bauhinia variegata TaxID=167791 RepID=A0ACB9P9B4_BAUVA|nr:hypothetical protein L6164_011817 [Bauhinia variegata]